MREFFMAQIDYFSFVNASAFILLFAILRLRRRLESERIPWDLFAFFGLFHGINGLAGIGASGFIHGTFLQWICFSLKTISWVLLCEFSRRSFSLQGLSRCGLWVYIPAALFLGAWAAEGISGLNTASSYMTGMSLLAAGLVFWREIRHVFRWMSVALLIYGGVLFLSASGSFFSPGRLIGQDHVFVSLFFLVQFVSVLCAAAILLFSWDIERANASVDLSERSKPRWLWPLGTAVFFLIGFFLVNWRADLADTKMREHLLKLGVDLARTINPERVKALTFTAEDQDNISFQILRKQFIEYGEFVGLENIYSMAWKDGHIVFGPENIHPGTPFSSAPGTVYQEPRPEDLNAFQAGKPYVLGPVKDEYGVFVSVGAPVFDPRTKQVLMMVAIDVKADHWMRQIAMQRIGMMAILFLIMMIFFAGKVLVHCRQKDAAAGGGFRRIEGLGVLILGLCLSAGAAALVYEYRWYVQKNNFENVAYEKASLAREKLERIRSYFLPGIAQFFFASEKVTREEFRIYTQSLLKTFSIAGCGWAPYIGPKDRLSFESEISQESGEEAHIFYRDRSGRKIISPYQQEGYYPLFYVEPYEEIRSAVGFDIASDALRWQAARQSFSSGFAVASDRIYRVSNEEAAINVYLPVARGFVYVTFRPGALIQEVFGQMPWDETLSVDFFELKGQGKPVWIASRAVHPMEKACYGDISSPGCRHVLTSVYPLMFFGKTYAFVVHSDDKSFFRELMTEVSIVFLLGMLLTLVVAFFVDFLVNKQLDLEKEVLARTKEMKALNDHAVASAHFLQNLMDAIPNPLFFKDVRGIYRMCNQAFERYVGRSKDEIVGKTVHGIAPAEPAEKYAAVDMTMIAEPVACQYEGRMRYADGTFREVLFNKASFLGIDGKMAGIVGVMTDISDRKEMEESLREAKERAERADKAKSDFIANMSHEIRTPMNAIIGFGELLNKTSLEKKQKEYLGHIVSGGKIVLRIINDILDLSRISVGKMMLQQEDVDVRSVVADAVAVAWPLVSLEKVRLSYTIAPDVPEIVRGDGLRLRQILVNLLGNAVKFTKQGKITVVVRRADGPASPGEMKLLFSVEDTGVGVAAEKLTDIFKPFEQADMSITKEYGGTGLGLSICQRLVELMGGKIWAESVVGQGSKFSFTVLFHEGGKEDPGVNSRGPEGARVLVAEDNHSNRELMRVYLETLGCYADYAVNGKEALERLSEMHKYDLCLMDVHMPVMDGLEAVREIRVRISKDFPVLAMTGTDRKEDLDACIQAGMTDHLLKPVDLDILKQKICQYRDGRKA